MSAALPLCRDCKHAHDERRPARSAPPILTCDRYRSLADGVTRIACDAARNLRCGLAATGFEAKGSPTRRAVKPVLPTRAIISQIQAIRDYAKEHDEQKALIRGEMLSALETLMP